MWFSGTRFLLAVALGNLAQAQVITWAGQTADVICPRWNREFAQATSSTDAAFEPFPAPTNSCSPVPSLASVARDNAYLMMNLLRFVSGLDPAVDDPTYQTASDEMALMFWRNNSISHHPPPDWECYTAPGDQSAGSSNIASGYANPADALYRGWLPDGGSSAATLGHRRWNLDPTLATSSFGWVGPSSRTGFGGQKVFGGPGQHNNSQTYPPIVGYPAPGVYPWEHIQRVKLNATHSHWSMSIKTSVANPSGTVVRRSTGANILGYILALPGGYGPNTVRLDVTTAELAPNEIYDVDVSVDSGRYQYSTELIACANWTGPPPAPPTPTMTDAATSLLGHFAGLLPVLL